jgi:hypothetical protein
MNRINKMMFGDILGPRLRAGLRSKHRLWPRNRRSKIWYELRSRLWPRLRYRLDDRLNYRLWVRLAR